MQAQDPYAITISREDGLPSNSVYHIFQDSRGFIWITTNEGLSRYDGYEFKTYTSRYQSSKAGTEIHEDKYGRIWYQNFDGFLYYVTNDTLGKLAQNAPAGYYHFGITGNRLFVVQKKGIDLYDLKTLARIKTISLEPTLVSSTQQTDSYFYVFAERLFRIDSLGRTEAFDKLPLKREDMPSLMQKNGNELFMVSVYNKHKCCYYVKDKQILSRFALNMPTDHIQSLSYTDSTYWFCTPTGVYGYSDNGNSINSGKGFFRDKSISSVLRDREGNYWFSTTNAGLLLVPNLKTRLHRTEFRPNRIRLVDSGVYVATKADELYKVDLGTLSTKQIYKGSSNQEIYMLGYDSVNRYLTFTSREFRITDLQGKVMFKWAAPVKDFKRIDDKYYAYTVSGVVGLLSLKPALKSKWDKFLEGRQQREGFLDIQLLTGIRGKSLILNKDKTCIYYATSNGFFRADTGSVKELYYRRGTIYITRLVECASRIFAIDEQGNLYELRGDELQIIALNDMEPAGQGIKTIKSEGGYLFLTTHKKLYYLDPSEKKAALYEIPVNIPSAEIADVNVYKGRLILATDGGLLFPEFDMQHQERIDPLCVINSVKANGRVLDPRQISTLSYNENNIEINYSILCFRNGSQYPLYYKINDQPWELASPESRLLKFASLSPGEYTIGFRMGDAGKKNDPLPLRFEITKPWWTQNWFILLCFVSILSAVYVYYKWQIALLHKRNKLLSEKMDLEKHLNRSILTSIRSQMNPHFFYNALNTIQSFIFSDDKKNAAAYLSKFSKLTRTILEHSEKEKITLHEEITALNLYLDIEKVRFNNDFDFKIHVSEMLDKDLVKIPPMLIQPYVENAIKHGLLHKKNKKELHIGFTMEDGFLQIVIDDNGIGRKRSAELNKIKQGAHRSFASNANQMRLEILNKDSKAKTAVRYLDKVDSEQHALGTTVIINLPVNNYERNV